MLLKFSWKVEIWQPTSGLAAGLVFRDPKAWTEAD